MKKFLLFGFIFILLSSFALATLQPANTVVYWTMDNIDLSGGQIEDTSYNSYDSTTQQAVTGAAGIINQSFNYVPNDETFTTAMDAITSTSDYTISLWINPDTVSGTRYVWAGKYNSRWMQMYMDGSTLKAEQYDTGWKSTSSSTTFSTSTWYMVTMTYNDTANLLKLYVNGAYESQVTANGVGSPINSFNLGKQPGGSSYFDGRMDEVSVWNVSLSAGDVSDLYNSGAGLQFPYTPPTPPAPGTDTLNITSVVLPANYTQFNFNTLNFNLSVNASNGFSAYLYLNNTLNQTRSFSSGSGVFVSFNATIPDGDHNFYINVTDPISNDSEKTANHIFYIDTLNPTINWYSPTAANSTVLLGNLTTNITIADNNLFSYQYNLSWSNGSVIYSSTNTTLTGLTSVTLSDEIDLSTYIGTIRASLLVCDGHTSNNVTFDSIEVVDNELVVEEVDISLVDKTDTQDIDYEQQNDKYNFDFETVASSTVKEFYVESDNYIHILHGQTEYEGHLVMGDKWMDFESEDIKSISIVRINDYKVKVTVEKNSATDLWEFESIGTLNCVTQYKKLLSLTSTEAYNQFVLSGDSTSYQLNVTYNSSFMGAVSGSLYWNNTAYAATATNNGNVYTLDVSKTIPPYSTDFNITNFWSFTFDSTNINTTSNIQEIYAPKIDDCSAYTTNWVNYSIKDETSYALINGSIEYAFSYSNGLYTGSLNGNESNADTFTFCMYPAWANFTTDITIQYSTAISGYTARDYVKTGYIIDNATSFVDLLLLQGATDILFHVVNDEDTNLQNVFIEAYKYDVPTDSDILVESEYTDFNGEVILNLAKGTTYYSFKFYVDGVLKLQTSRFKLFSTSYEFILRPASTSPLATWLILDSEVTRSLTFDNDSKLVNFSWDYPGDAVSQFCLNINGNGTNWTSSCSTDMTGSLSYTLTSFNISYLADGLAHVNSTIFTLESLTIDTRTSLKDIFGSGLTLFIALIMFLTISLLGLVNKSVAVLMGMVAIMIMWLFALIPIGWISLIGILFIGIIIMVVMNKR